MGVAITFDPAKREWTLKNRGLDFLDAALVFGSANYATAVDDRRDYGEVRYITAGFLRGEMVVFAWTPRGADHHVISMRYCHAKEEAKWRERIG